jgi:2-polyprenyl-6-methoxyphenol hydroxylase-like FAD-dependent oxidoreductase
MRAGHAVVVGGSVAGLFAAGAAAAHFERVTVVERDRLEDGPVTRKGSPQGNQIHILLPIGEHYIDQIFPGIHRDLVDAGCEECNHTSDTASYVDGAWRLRVKTELTEVVAFRRPLLEWIVRRRLLGLANVDIVHGTATGLELEGGDIAGVRLASGELLRADFVVDAAGRGSRAPKWLRELGFDAPEEDEVRVYMGYATQFIRVPPDALDRVRGLSAAPTPEHPVGGVLLPADNGVHSLAAIGLMRDYPPADREGMLAFLERASTPLVAEVARASEPVSRVNVYKQPGNILRRWERLERRPGRFVVVGDAVASFNPVYGQGMTMAAQGATLLGATLAEASLDEVPALFHEALRPGVELAFSMAASGDALYEGAELKNFEKPSEEQQARGKRMAALAKHDPEISAAMLEAFFWLRPEALEREEIKRRIETAELPEPGEPEDPREYPKTVIQPALV